MEIENSTVVKEFILLGLTQSQNIQLLVFVLVLIFYLIILPGNFLIILTIRSDPGLTAPLYFFLGNLALGFVHSIIQVALILRLPFCGPNQLDNFFCDVPQVIKLACTDTFVVELLMVFNSGLLTLLCFLGLLASYAVIICRAHRSSSEGKNNALSTCTTHVIIILIMFGPAIFIYTRPFRTLPVDKVVSFFHTVIIPLLNPVIYTFRNQEVKSAMRRLLSQYVVC
ncbi:PREDICTED: olfactory receptor 4N4-like [Myotis davidii]|uniref:olfactory receptor 4N4-like n=1 Tax=Myotis davidii TaxID=225400 RepID=UPI0007675CF2|nr:PREDICTED: olfactory receptor 4N4-like [Myotis davidii]